MSTVHLIDASPYIFRAYFSLPSSMVDRDGQRAGAVYGFTSFLLKLIDDESPTHVAVAFDGSLTTSFRNELFPSYKAQRDLPDAALEAQLDDCREIARALGLATFIDDRFEADDLIATWAHRLAAAPNVLRVVVTSDKDLAQLVDDRTVLFDYARGERYDIAAVRRKFGVAPVQLPDYLGLAGDPVDNIPGVRGIGRKTAIALLARFRDLDSLYENLDRVGELPIRGARSIVARLEAGRDSAFLSRRLATVSTEAPLQGRIEDLALRSPRPELEPLCDRLGFRGILRRARDRGRL